MPNCPNSTHNPVHFVRTSREMTERIHAYGSKIFLMMSAGFGRVTIPTNLGGNLLPGGAPEFKEDDLALARWYAVQLEKLSVPVYLNTEIKKGDVLNGSYDTMIIATGSTPKRFPLGDDERVYTAEQVLMKEKDCGAATVVVGGGLVG